jgi:hypothetical protein
LSTAAHCLLLLIVFCSFSIAANCLLLIVCYCFLFTELAAVDNEQLQIMSSRQLAVVDSEQ